MNIYIDNIYTKKHYLYVLYYNITVYIKLSVHAHRDNEDLEL